MTAATTILGYALMPTVAALLGGLVADRIRLSATGLGLALHTAAGVVMGIVAVELLPTTLRIGPPWLVLTSFLAGGLFFILVDRVTEMATSLSPTGGEPRDQGHWVFAIGIGIDLFTDGVMIAAGYAVEPALGLLLAMGAIIVEASEGFSTVAVFVQRGVPRRVRLLLLGGLVAVIPAGALAGLLVVARPIGWQVSILAFTAGMLATLLIEEITPRSHECQEGRWATLAYLGGFTAFAMIGVVLG